MRQRLILQEIRGYLKLILNDIIEPDSRSLGGLAKWLLKDYEPISPLEYE